MHASPIALVADLMPQWLDELQQKADHPSVPPGPVTGLRDLDHVLQGFRPAELTIIGARPAMGKTSLVVNIATHVSVDQGLRVLVYSEKASTMVSRMVATIGNIEGHNLRSGGMTETEWPALTAAVDKLRGARIFLREMLYLGQPDIAEEVIAVNRSFGPLDLVLIDNLTPDVDQSAPSRRVLATHRLKELAVRLQIPIVATTLLSSASAIELRAVRRPVLSGLDIESVERDADVVMYLHREQYYAGGSNENFGLAEVFVARNRGGPTANIKLGFRQGVARFENLSAEQAAELSTQRGASIACVG